MTARTPEGTNHGGERDPNQAPGGASCGVSDAYPASAPKGAEASRSAVGPGVPTQREKPTAVSTASRRRRPRHSAQRRTCTSLRFSEAEWAAVQHAADAADLAPGGFAAAATLAAATSANPTAAVADYRRGIQELMESNRQLGAVGNNLNQLAHYVNAGGQPGADLRQLLHRVEDAIGAVDEAVAWLVRR